MHNANLHGPLNCVHVGVTVVLIVRRLVGLLIQQHMEPNIVY